MRTDTRVMVAVFLLAGACGGTAVIDLPTQEGDGGSAGATGSTTPSSSSSGPIACNCQQFCNLVEPCGFLGAECLALCDDAADQELLQCVCDSQGSCPVIGECLGGTGGSGGGSGLSPACTSCLGSAVADEPCESLLDQCAANAACTGLGDCLEGCGWTAPCITQCEAGYPGGVGPMFSLMSCAMCNECPTPCLSSDAFAHFCTLQ